MIKSILRTICTVVAVASLAACIPAAESQPGAAAQQTAVGLVVLTFEAATGAAAQPTSPPAEPSPTFAPPRLYLNTEVQCRSGIGSDFAIIAT